MRRLWAASAAIATCLALGGLPTLSQEASENPAATCPPGALPAASIDPALVPDAEGFLFEDVGPGVRRLVSDGAGHFPSARYLCEARDMDRIAVRDDGSVVVWSTPHGIDNELGGYEEVWILGREGSAPGSTLPASSWDPTADAIAPDGSRWWSNGRSRGVTRSDALSSERFLEGYRVVSLAVAQGGRVWVAVGHDDGEAGGIFVIEPGVQGSGVPEKVCGLGAGTLTVGISDLTGMEGLELTAKAGTTDVELFDLVIDGSPFEASDSCRIEPRVTTLAIAVGAPPCAWSWGWGWNPSCGEQGSGGDVLFHCATSFEAVPDGNIWIWISGLPEAGRVGGCPVVSIGNHASDWMP
jgi:hypothetical protein